MTKYFVKIGNTLVELSYDNLVTYYILEETVRDLENKLENAEHDLVSFQEELLGERENG